MLSTRGIKSRSFSTSSFGWLLIDFEFQLKNLNETIILNNAILSKKRIELNEIKTNLDIAIKVVDEESHEYYGLTYIEEGMLIKELQTLQLSSCLYIAFAIFETKLKELCELIKIEASLKLKYNDLKSVDGELGTFWKYLTDYFDVNLTTIAKEYDEIKKHKLIRNAFIHNRGIIKVSDFNKIKGLHYLSFINEYGEIQIEFISSEYIDELIKLMNSVFTKLLELSDNRL